MMTAWATPASQNRSYQSVIQSPAPNSARNAMQPRQAQNSGRGQRLARVSRLASHATALIVALIALCWPLTARAQGTIIPFVPQQFYDSNGDPCSGCKLYAYAAGTSTPQATYSDVTLTTANANPVVMNAAGRPTTGYIFLSATSYKFEFQSAASVVLWTVDNASAIPTTATSLDVTGTAGEALSAGDAVYLSDGSGALNAGRWYKADADNTYSSSTAGMAGIAPAAIASGASGSIRISGRVTGLSGLTAGELYYSSATAGALTATPPTNARFLGEAESTTVLILQGNPGGVRLPDSDGTHSVVVRTSSNLTADRIVTIITGDQANTLTFPTIQTITSTGTQNDLAVTAARYLLLRVNNASLVTITGMSAGTDGDVIDMVSIGAGRVDLTHQGGGSTAAQRLINFATVGLTQLAAGSGTARFVYDGTTARWRLVEHEQGAWITPTFAAGDYTSATGSWTVASGDVLAHKYWLKGRTLTYINQVSDSTVGTTPSTLQIAIPASHTAVGRATAIGWAIDNGATREGLLASATDGATVISINLLDATAFANATDATALAFTIVVEVP